MSEPRILVRADGGGRLGAGHVTRCITLADELARRGAVAEFVVRAPASLVRRIVDHGHRVVQLSPEPLDRAADGPWSHDEQLDDAGETMLRASEFDAVVVDHYGLSATWERAVGGREMVVLDDLANRPHRCNVLSDPNWYGPHTSKRYDSLVDDDCVLLLGPRYALLQEQYRTERSQHLDHRWPPERVLVTFGGTDAAGETEKVVLAMSDREFRALQMTVVVGTEERADNHLRGLIARRPGTELVVAAASLAPLLARADLVVGASGAGTWERLCLDVPAIVATSSLHQSGVTKAFADAGLTWWVGLTSETDRRTYQTVMRSLRSTPRPILPQIVDGFGAGRVAEMIVPGREDQIGVRGAVAADAPSLIGLRRETTGSGADLLDGPGVWVSEVDAFLSENNTGNTPTFVVDMVGIPLGSCSVGPDGAFEVLLQRPLQGRGLETSIVRALIAKRRIRP